MNEYINMLRAVAKEADLLATRLGEEKNRAMPTLLSAQELHDLRVRLTDLNRRTGNAPLNSHA
jgi:hypothetical protein